MGDHGICVGDLGSGVGDLGMPIYIGISFLGCLEADMQKFTPLQRSALKFDWCGRGITLALPVELRLSWAVTKNNNNMYQLLLC